MTYSKDVLDLNPQLRDRLKTVDNTVSPSKYGNARTEANGMIFDSGHEAAGVSQLILREKAGDIFALRLQVRFPLPGKTTYIADAVYSELQDGKLVTRVVDFKGFRTKEYRIKRRLFKEKYGMEIMEA